ncbi:helix-turn-helix domain-containing protein [Microbacterium esteraromaticum]|uniref:helix-turn-helix domain-containing protein n=1 Tax=Microbacterium esteraromaticum TaxID=57043 RepID=UPI001C9713AC|nr:helix-turn-helix transcriptional regulator [Microbacterium esteraromaticum]MBY6061602.1 helix-turn-helix domain-containing protein [Microbacterium esteraromaticum]
MTGCDAASVGARVAAYRRLAGLTAEQLADRVGGGMTRTGIAKLETGRRVEVSTELLVQLAWALQVPPMALLFPLESPSATMVVGEQIDTVEGFGGWLEGVTPAGASRATAVANQVLTEYRSLSLAYSDFLASVHAGMHLRLERSAGEISEEEQEASDNQVRGAGRAMHRARLNLESLHTQLQVKYNDG